MERIITISCDGHIGPPVEQFHDYIDPKYRHLMPELIEDEDDLQIINQLVDFNNPERLSIIDPRDRISSGGHEGGWKVERRLQELDAEGIAAEVVFPGTNNHMTPFFYQFNRPYSDDIRWAGIQAYHRWAAENMIGPSGGRIIGTIEPGASLDLDKTIVEMKFCAERGFRGIYVPGVVKNPAMPPLYSDHFEPFWAACNEMGLVLTVHVGWGLRQGEFTSLIKHIKDIQNKLKTAGKTEMGFEDAWSSVMGMMDENNPLSLFALGLGPRQIIWQLIFSGVFDRYPNLKLQVAECRADWVPELKSYLDERYFAAKVRPTIRMKPSEYFGQNIFISPSNPRRLEVNLRHSIGLDSFMFAADFPHPESTWPNTREWLQAAFHDVPERELRAIMGENAIGVYGLDKAILSKIAERIGYLPSDVLGDHHVDKHLIDDWNMRSNFSSPTPPFDHNELNERINADLIATAA